MLELENNAILCIYDMECNGPSHSKLWMFMHMNYKCVLTFVHVSDSNMEFKSSYIQI
jgi:hypothetical protein